MVKEIKLEQVSGSQVTLGIGPAVLPSRRGSLSEVFGAEVDWQAHLVENPSLLASLFDRPIDLVEPSPYYAGGLRPDLAINVDGHVVLVELQTGVVDPRHLGQVFRYQRAGADCVLWLAEEVRPDYVACVNDLNRLEGARIALAEVISIQVAGGWTFDARLVAGELPKAGGAPSEASPPTNRQRQYERFWTLLFEHAEEQGFDLFRRNRPTRQPWLRTPWRDGSGIYYSIHPSAGRVRVALVVSPSSRAYGEEVYAAVAEQADTINAAFSEGHLHWEASESGGRIEATARGGYAVETERGIEVTVSLLQRMAKVFDPLLESLPLNLLSQAAGTPQYSLF